MRLRDAACMGRWIEAKRVRLMYELRQNISEIEDIAAAKMFDYSS
jgi:hypothetical protein